MTTTADSIHTFLNQYPNLKTMELLVPDLNGLLRGKRVERDLIEKVFTKGFYLPASVMGLAAHGATVEEAGLGAQQGDKDNLCKPVLDTLSIMPWKEGETHAQVLCDMLDDNGEPFELSSRQVLQKAIKQFETLGYSVGIALELEFYLIDHERDALGNLQPPKSPLTGKRFQTTQVYAVDDLDQFGDFVETVVTTARQQNIPADTVIAEYAPGQFEVNLDYGEDILKACDQAILLKRVIHHIAKQQGFQATFMAKPYIEESGNGLHIHLSLYDKAGNNSFRQPGTPIEEQPLLNQAISGLLENMDNTMGLYTPYCNSFRRFAIDSYAPTSKCWGVDNRTVALRIPRGSESATRIEHRLPGADANPYLATAALLFGVYQGLTQSYPTHTAIEGNAYEQDIAQVPDNQRDALRLLENNQALAEFLGKDFLDLYLVTKWADVHSFEKQVTPKEYDWLLPYI